MNKLASLCIAALLLSNTKLSAQTGFWESHDAYLGQKPPGDKPKIFAQNLLAQKDTFALDRVAFSTDGREFYFTLRI